MGEVKRPLDQRHVIVSADSCSTRKAIAPALVTHMRAAGASVTLAGAGAILEMRCVFQTLLLVRSGHGHPRCVSKRLRQPGLSEDGICRVSARNPDRDREIAVVIGLYQIS